MLIVLLRLIAALPLSVLQTIGRALGLAVYAVPGRYRQRLRANAAQAGYTDPAFARRAAAETGAMILETLRIWFHTERCLPLVTSDTEDVLQSTWDEGRGILFLTPHLGCFEISARYVATRYPLTVMFRPPRQAYLGPVMEVVRNNAAATAVPATMQGVREFVRALRRKQCVGLLPDQAPGVGEGVWAPFFGKPAYTMTLPGKLATQANAPVVLVGSERLPHGKGWRVHYLRLPEPLPESAEAQAAMLNDAMATMIRSFPEQYLWGYNRYKTRGNPPSADTGAPPDDALATPETTPPASGEPS